MKWIGTRTFARGSSIQVWCDERNAYLRFLRPRATSCNYEIAIPAADVAAIAALLARAARSFITDNHHHIDTRKSST